MIPAATPPDKPPPQSRALVLQPGERVASRRLQVISEFQPDAVEIEERVPPRVAFLTLYMLMLLIAAAILWASVSLVDKIVVAPGKLITTQPNVVVQPLETSVIRAIEVAVGDTVRKGQTLARLDPTFTQSDMDQLQSKAFSLEARIKRLEAELAGMVYAPTINARPDELLEARVFVQRTAYYVAQMQNFEQQIARADANLATTRAEQAILKQRQERVLEIEKMRGDLYKSQSGSRLNLLLSEDARLGIEANLARIAGNLIELQHAREKAQAEQRAFVGEFGRSAVEQLVEAHNQYKATSEELKKAKLRQHLVVLSSPTDAVVLDVAQRSIGSVVREAEPLFTLVPIDVPIEAEVTIEARDIGQIGVGQLVRLKLDAFPFQQHGTAMGLVRVISNDAFPVDPKGDRAPRMPSLSYRARIEVTDTNLRAIPKTFRLIPGMTVAAEIKIGHRSVISYFLDPLIRGLDESIREP